MFQPFFMVFRGIKDTVRGNRTFIPKPCLYRNLKPLLCGFFVVSHHLGINECLDGIDMVAQSSAHAVIVAVNAAAVAVRGTAAVSLKLFLA